MTLFTSTWSMAADPSDMAWQESFTEPCQSIDVAAGQPGKIVTVRVKRGDRVSQGDLIVELDDRVLQAERAVAESRAKANAHQEAAKVDMQLKSDRYRKLYELHTAGAGSVEEVRKAKAEADVARLRVIEENELAQQRQLELAEIESRLETRRIRSPIDGDVTDVLYEMGEFVSASDTQVARIVNLDELRVTFYVPTAVSNRFHTKDNVELIFPETSMEATGVIEHVGLVTDASSSRVRVDVLVNNSDRRYRSGVLCHLRTDGEI